MEAIKAANRRCDVASFGLLPWETDKPWGLNGKMDGMEGIEMVYGHSRMGKGTVISEDAKIESMDGNGLD